MQKFSSNVVEKCFDIVNEVKELFIIYLNIDLFRIPKSV